MSRYRVARVLAALGLVLLAWLGIEAYLRETDPFAAAERRCAHVLAPGEADSAERHECLRREVGRSSWPALVPGAVLLVAAGIAAVATARGRAGRVRAGWRAGPSRMVEKKA